MSRISAIVGDRDLTALHSGLRFSNSDPGGFESADLSPMNQKGAYAGQPVSIFCGNEWAFMGRVNEPGSNTAQGREQLALSVAGIGAALKDNPYRMIYVDRDLSHWGPAPRNRVASYTLLQGWSHDAGQQAPDPHSGLPAIRQNFLRMDNTAGKKARIENWYDAGPDLFLSALYWDVETFQNGGGAMGASAWVAEASLSTNDYGGTFDNSADQDAGGAGYLGVGGVDRRWASLRWYYNAVITADGDWNAVWRKLTVYGLHNLTRRGSDPGGFYPTDIVGHALAQSGCAFASILGDATSYIVPHLAYLERVPASQVIDDMAKIMGWSWGVWEPRGFASLPTLIFAPPPTEATVVVQRSELEDLNAPSVRLDELYDRAVVKWVDAAGTSGFQTVTLANPLLSQAGIGSRTLELDMGLGSAASATTFGTFALQLQQRAARGAGSCMVPDRVTTAAGGRMPAALLKAGRDRIRILDLPDAGPWTEADTRRFDTFHIRRVETTVDETGQPRTRVEFDGGADLLEVLAARLEQARIVTGS